MSVKPSSRYLLLVVIVIVGLGLFWARGQREVSADTDETYQKLRLLAEVLQTVQAKYVEPPDPEKLIYGAIKGMVSSLDPHSAFLSPDEFKELQIETAGKFSGIGIEISIRDGVLTVISPIEGTPAYEVGLEPGDRIIKIDGKLTKQMTLMDAVKLIRGPRGEAVTLTILREGVRELKDYVIVRDVIPVTSVKSRLLEPGYGYLRITNFQSRTNEEVSEELAELERQAGGLKGLILDLRNNPGGLLNQAVEVADAFLEDGLIVYTEGRQESQDMKFYAHADSQPQDYPLVVLVNQGSASASEIVAGALQDHRRAIILGTQTFGKGSVQTIIPFGDDSGLRLTTARYYTPSGNSIQAKGISPDVIVDFVLLPEEQPETGMEPIREADLEGHFEAAGEEEIDEEAAEEKQTAERLRRDNQLREALSLLKALNVFSRPKAQVG